MKKRYLRTKDRIGALYDKWKEPLWLGGYRITLDFCYDGGEFPSEQAAVSEVAARCYADWRYQSALIKFNVPACAGLNDKELESVVVHELVHVLVDEIDISPKQHDHLERVVSTLTSILTWQARQSAATQPGNVVAVDGVTP